MSLRIIDKNICLNDVIICTKSYVDDSAVEVVKVKEEHLAELYNLTNKDICNNVEVYCDMPNYSINLFKENDKTFICKAIEVDETESITIDSFNELVKEKFSNIAGIDVVADEDSIEDSLNFLLSTQLDESESIKEASTKIDNACSELLKSIL